jgi:hypothetical protein
MLPGIPHRHHGPRLSMPGIGLLHHNGHDHHTRAIALASWSAGLVVGTAAGAIMFRGRHAGGTGGGQPSAMGE